MGTMPFDHGQMAAMLKPINGTCNAGRHSPDAAGAPYERCDLEHGHQGECRWPSRTSKALRGATDDQLHAECRRRGMRHMETEQADALQKICDDFSPEEVDFAPFLRSELTELAVLRREKAAAAEANCDHERHLKAHRDFIAASRANRMGEAGPGIAAKPAPRTDHSVAFLDEDLLCEDA